MSRFSRPTSTEVPRQGVLTGVSVPNVQIGSTPLVNGDLQAIQGLLGQISGVANQFTNLTAQTANISRRNLAEHERVESNAGTDAGLKTLGSILSRMEQGLHPVNLDGDAGEDSLAITSQYVDNRQSDPYKSAFERRTLPQVQSLYRRLQRKGRTKLDDSVIANFVPGIVGGEGEVTEESLRAQIKGLTLSEDHDPEQTRRDVAVRIARDAAALPDPRHDLIDIAEKVGGPGIALGIRQARNIAHQTENLKRTELRTIFEDLNVTTLDQALDNLKTPDEAIDQVITNAEGLLDKDDPRTSVIVKNAKNRMRSDLQHHIRKQQIMNFEREKQNMIRSELPAATRRMRQSRGEFTFNEKAPLVFDEMRGKHVATMTDDQWQRLTFDNFVARLHEGKHLPQIQARHGAQAALHGSPTGAIGDVESARRVLAEAGVAQDTIDAMDDTSLIAEATPKRLSLELRAAFSSGMEIERMTTSMVRLKTMTQVPRTSPDLDQAMTQDITNAYLLDDYGLLPRHMKDTAMVEMVRDAKEMQKARLGTMGQIWSTLSQWRERELNHEFSSVEVRKDIINRLDGMGIDPGTNPGAVDDLFRRVQFTMITAGLLRPEDAMDRAAKGYERTTHIVGKKQALPVGGFDEQWSKQDSLDFEKNYRGWYASTYPDDISLVDGDWNNAHLIRAGNGFTLGFGDLVMPNAFPVKLTQASRLMTWQRNLVEGEDANHEYQYDLNRYNEVIADLENRREQRAKEAEDESLMVLSVTRRPAIQDPDEIKKPILKNYLRGLVLLNKPEFRGQDEFNPLVKWMADNSGILKGIPTDPGSLAAQRLLFDPLSFEARMEDMLFTNATAEEITGAVHEKLKEGAKRVVERVREIPPPF